MKSRLILFVIILFVSYSCKDQNNRNALLPSVTGVAGEVVMVMEDDYWESRIGEKWKEICTEPVIGLPQTEPMFNLVRIPKDAFTSIFKSHRNLVLTKINTDNDSTFLTLQKDIWARPQLILTINAPDKDKYYAFISDNAQKISDILLGTERNRIINNYKKYEESKIRQKLEKNHFISLKIPKGYKLDVDSADFIWISHETPYISQGIFIYYYDYTDTAQLAKASLIDKRNQILKKNVPGSLPGSYMTTDTVYPAIYDQYYLNDLYIAELKGLWRTEKDFMGGPFQSFTTVDEKRNRIITIDSYVYSPKYKKRNYMRQMEAILYTLKIVE